MSEDGEPDTETETETETETDGGWTTDDEPTIRPPHSSGSSEDSRSICSASDTGDENYDRHGDLEDDVGFGDDEKDDKMDVEESAGGGGDRTPDRHQRGRDGERTPEGTFERGARKADRDHRMDSP